MDITRCYRITPHNITFCQYEKLKDSRMLYVFETFEFQGLAVSYRVGIFYVNFDFYLIILDFLNGLFVIISHFHVIIQNLLLLSNHLNFLCHRFDFNF